MSVTKIWHSSNYVIQSGGRLNLCVRAACVKFSLNIFVVKMERGCENIKKKLSRQDNFIYSVNEEEGEGEVEEKPLRQFHSPELH